MGPPYIADMARHGNNIDIYLIWWLLG